MNKRGITVKLSSNDGSLTDLIDKLWSLVSKYYDYNNLEGILFRNDDAFEYMIGLKDGQQMLLNRGIMGKLAKQLGIETDYKIIMLPANGWKPWSSEINLRKLELSGVKYIIETREKDSKTSKFKFNRNRNKY